MTTRTDWRQTCVELAESVRYLIGCIDGNDHDPVALMECREHLSQTRAALSQPSPVAVAATCPYIRQGDSDSQWCALAEHGTPQPSPVAVAERLPELRRMFERILCAARSSGGPTVGNIQLADRLIDAVVSWSGDALPLPGAEVG